MVYFPTFDSNGSQFRVESVNKIENNGLTKKIISELCWVILHKNPLKYFSITDWVTFTDLDYVKLAYILTIEVDTLTNLLETNTVLTVLVLLNNRDSVSIVTSLMRQRLKLQTWIKWKLNYG